MSPRLRACLSTLSLLVAVSAYAQQERVELRRNGSIDVREVVEAVQEQSHYLFAYDERVFDLDRKVEAGATEASVEELLELITKGTRCTWVVSGTYIVIHLAPAATPVVVADQARGRTNDKYEPSGTAVDVYDPRPEQPGQPAAQATPTAEAFEALEAFSDWRNPDTYSPIKNATPRGAIKADVIYGATTLTPNAGVELALGARSTLELTGGWNQRNHEGRRKNNKKINHGLARAEYRWWMCERFDGLYVGANLFGTVYNVGGYDVPGLFARKWRYEGWAAGAGVNWGYHLALAPRWGVDLHAGVGVMKYKHTRFECTKCGTEIDRPSGVWFGPTRAGVDIVFMLWK